MVCKSCGKDDHCRRSSNKCLYYKPSQKKLNDGTETEKETFTIKCGLGKFIKNPELYQQIQNDVFTVSSMMIEASILLNYKLNKNPDMYSVQEKEPDFLLEFYQLKDNTRNKIDKVDLEYKEFRNEYNIPLHKGKLKSFLIQGAAKQLQTCVKNNITVHMYSRLQRYFRHAYSDKVGSEINMLLKKLFSQDSNASDSNGSDSNGSDNNSSQDDYEDDTTTQTITEFRQDNTITQIITQFRQQFGCETLNFNNLSSQWWKYFGLLHRLQKYFMVHEIKSFKLVPIFSFGRKHLLYTRDALYETLSSIGVKIKKEAVSLSEWCSYFKLTKYMSSSKQITFGGSISTNGIDVSIHLRRPKCNNNIVTNNTVTNSTTKEDPFQLQLVKSQFRQGVYSKICGIDPGLRYMFGMVSLHQNGTVANRLLKNSAFRHRTGEIQRKRQLKKLTRAAIAFNDESVLYSSKADDYVSFTKFLLRNFVSMQKLYFRRQVAKLKWEKKIKVRKAVDKLADEIIDSSGNGDNKYNSSNDDNKDSSSNDNNKVNNNKTLIAYGDGQIGPRIKGYVRLPQKHLLEALKRKRNKCTVVLIDEFRTTKLCSNCFFECKTSQSPHRFQVCQHCKLTWNRDINGANNILKKLLYTLLDLEIHVNLQRGTRLL